MHARRSAAQARRPSVRVAGRAPSGGSESGFAPAFGALDAAGVLQLQRAVGNAGVAALLQRCGMGGCTCGGACKHGEEELLLEERARSTVNRSTRRVLARLSPEEREENLQSSKYSGNDRLQRAFDNNPAIHIGESGEAVKLVQEGLKENCFKMPLSTKPTGELDSKFGQETFDIVEAFQEKHRLDVDGIVGRQTLRRLDELANTKPECPRTPEGPPVSEPATPPTPTKRVTVNITQLAGSRRNIKASLAVARKIYKQAGIEIVKGSERHLGKTESKALIGEDLILLQGSVPGPPIPGATPIPGAVTTTSEERALYKVNNTPDAVSAYFAQKMESEFGEIRPGKGVDVTGDHGQSYPPSSGAGIVGFEVQDSGSAVTFAHELGHVLLDSGGHCDGESGCDPRINLMNSAGPQSAAATLTDTQVKKMRESRFVK
jgi:peptidoglycan hydrolase-like protein with peptidoglycan-binding domain